MPVLLRRSSVALAGVLLVMLAGCGAATASGSPTSGAPTATATATLLPTATSTPEPTAANIVQTSFTCPETTSGTRTTFDDTATGLRFSFPAAWTERDCQRMTGAGGEQSLLVGNLFIVGISPRNGMTIQQWLTQNTDPQVEQDTLTPLAVAHAADAASVTVSSVPNAPRPPSQIAAIVAGSQQFYVVSPLTAQMSMTDTIPPLSRDSLVQQVVTTFDVP